MCNCLCRLAPLAIVAGLLAFSQPASAADWHTFWYRSKTDYYRVKAWPAPFNFVDRDLVGAPMAAMVHKGWQRQNTLGRFYFDPESQQLTEAGQRRVHEILTHNPPQYRTIYVVRAIRPEESEARIAAVQQVAQQMAGEDAMVLPTTVEPRGWSAEYINVIDGKMIQSMPDPVLPQFDASGGG